LLIFEREKDNLFADFPIGATIQDGGKRKRSDALMSHTSSSSKKSKKKKKKKKEKENPRV